MGCTVETLPSWAFSLSLPTSPRVFLSLSGIRLPSCELLYGAAQRPKVASEEPKPTNKHPKGLPESSLQMRWQSGGHAAGNYHERPRSGHPAELRWIPDLRRCHVGKFWDRQLTQHSLVGWHHRLYRQEFEQAPGAGDGQGGLACCSPWGRKELDTTERLN